MSTLYSNLLQKYEFIWPARNNAWPPENNISLEIANAASQMNFFTYAECNIRGQRRDLVIVSPDDEWICQVEVKHLYFENCENVLDDLWRIYKLDNFNKFIESIDTDEKNLQNYEKYGLFIAGGMSDIYKWWLSPNNQEYKELAKQYFSGVDNERINYLFNTLENWFNVKGCVKGLKPQPISDFKFWLAYYLTECGNEE